MVSTASLFNQLLKHFPRTEFAELVRKHGAERNAKGFSCWTQFVAMLFCQLAQTDSLREICNGLKCCLGKLVHLGVQRSPVRSTLSYANQHRPAALFEDLFWTVLNRFRQQQLLGSRPTPFRFRNKILLLDSTTISLCLSLFPWAGFKRTKGGVKAHVLLDHDDFMPRFVLITTAKASDVRMARSIPIPSQSIVVADRAYMDFSRFAQWNRQNIYFVCRSPFYPVFKVLAQRDVPARGNILTDEIVQFTGRYSGQYHVPLRRITVRLEDDDQPLILLTNHMNFAAGTIARIYKERWQIEVFFKTLKQNLKIKTFIGTSENALRIQIWTALIAILLLKWLHHLSMARWSLSNLASMLRLSLFSYRDLRTWLNHPFETPPHVPIPQQLPLLWLVVGQPIPHSAP
ncbi:MAG TPA: IS4 family transposase [Terriglobia bacterium]|nr:IS4 family transposase [Terriglobia bacterium]